MKRKTAHCSPDSPWIRGLRGAAEYLGIGMSTVQRDFPSWEKFGVTIYRYGRSTKKYPTGRELRFRKDELDRVLQPVN